MVPSRFHMDEKSMRWKPFWEESATPMQYLSMNQIKTKIVRATI